MARRRELRDEIDELFADLWHVSRISGLRRGFRPQLDCFRTDEPPLFTVVVDISGVDPDNVHVIASEQTLVISGVRKRQKGEGRVYQHMEIEYGSFERVLQLPDDADVSQAEARYDRGLLTIVMPIAAKAAQPERVPIEIRRAS